MDKLSADNATENVTEGVPQDWNTVVKLPDPTVDLIGNKLVESFAKPPDASKYSQMQKIILSRILGRSKDLSLPFNIAEAETVDFRKIDLATIMEEGQQLDILDGLCCVQDFAWFVSDRCWMCERWSYYLSLCTKTEIEACQDDIIMPNSKLVKLQPK